MDALPRPELTVRAVATGMLLGAALTPCNVYSGLKIGWSFNMSIAAGLLAAFCLERDAVPRAVRNRPALLEEFQAVLARQGIAFKIEALEEGPIHMQLDGELRQMDSPVIDVEIVPGRLNVLSSPPALDGAD